MGRKSKQRRDASSGAPEPAKSAGRSWSFLIVALVTVAGVSAVGLAIAANARQKAATPATAQPAVQARSLDALLKMTPEELAKVDIAEMNLLCAVGLPDAEGIDIDKCKATLDRWAERVKVETERHLYRLTDPRYKEHAEHYQHSEARFRAEWLVTVLQEDIGLHYHAGFIRQDEKVVPFKTSKEVFLHGLMDNDDPHKAFGGNCVSLPVAYAAVGRRLGYPIKLACSKEHMFCRWEGMDHPNPAWRARFNFDGAGRGFSIDPDEFYLSWPRKSTPEQVEVCDWLKTLTPQQELSAFMASRGHIFRMVLKDDARALVAYSESARLHPNRPSLQEVAEAFTRLWQREMADHPEIYAREAQARAKETQGPQDPAAVSYMLPPRGRPARDPEAEIQMINEINRRNMQSMNQPPGIAPPQVPYGQPGAVPPFQPPVPGQMPR